MKDKHMVFISHFYTTWSIRMANECVVDFYLTSIFHLLTPVNGEFIYIYRNIYISLSKTLCCREREFQVGWFSQWENDSWGRTSWYRTGAIIRVISFWIKKLEISGNGGWGGRRQISLFMQPKSIINKTWLPPRPSPLSLMTTNIQIRGHRAKYVYSFSYVLR